MCEKIITYLSNSKQQKDFRKVATERAKNYDMDGIVERFVADVGLSV